MKTGLIRHGESIWNQENRFTGWTDVDLTENGRLSSKGGKMLLEGGYEFDIAYTSVLKRAIRTLWIVLDGLIRCGFSKTYLAVKRAPLWRASGAE